MSFFNWKTIGIGYIVAIIMCKVLYKIEYENIVISILIYSGLLTLALWRRKRKGI